MKSKVLRKDIFRLIILVALFTFVQYHSSSASGKEEIPIKQELRFFSGSPAAGGLWYLISVGITQIFERSIPGLRTSLAPGGAGGGPISVGEGQSAAGLVNLGAFLDAQEGLPPFKKAYGNLMLLANLYDHVFQIIVFKDSGINKITDLKGKIISSGIKGQYSEFWFKKLLKVYNMDPERDVKIVNLGFGDTVSAMKDGRVDCCASAASMTNPGINELAASRNITFLSIDDAELKTFCETVNGFRPGIYPGSKVPHTGKYSDFKTAFMPLSVMVRADLPEDFVYKMSKALAENLKDLGQVAPLLVGFEPKDLAREISPRAKFHPGANKYYKEKRWR